MEHLVAERELFIWRTPAANFIERDCIRPLRLIARPAVALLVILCALFYSALSSAIGVGAAQTDSYIGQPLSVRIPLFNVTRPNSLSISLELAQFDGEGQAKVNAVLDRSNSQLSILVRSDVIINEPYVGFTLDIIDDNSKFSKDFVVLIDLPAKGRQQIDRALVQSNSLQGSFRPNTFVATPSAVISQSNDSRQSVSIMGPYDTAEAGRIPQKFGAVLDGQSIWRVARRINNAMGVSKSQMIWALYQANPSAFSSKSINSLKAGVFLTIPPQNSVAAVSDAQAQANLRALRNGDQPPANIATQATADSSIASDIKPAESAISEFDLAADIQADPLAPASDVLVGGVGQESAEPFQVSAIDSTGQQKGGALDSQSKAIIASLTETVSNMSQQLDRKDKKIEFLENQVKELSSFIANENLSSTTAGEAPVITQNVHAMTSEPFQAAISDARPSRESSFPLISVLKWGLLILLSLSVLAYLFRERLRELGRSLNLFGSNEHIELQTVIVEEAGPIELDTLNDIATEFTDKEMSSAISQKTDRFIDDTFESTERNRDIASVVKESLVSPEALNAKPYLDIADDDDGVALEFEVGRLESDLDQADGGDISFKDRFEDLLNDEDFEFARELLDFARYNEINDDRYHYQRLRLCEKMKDEDAFYEYYYGIESKISDFPQNLQTQISQLVVKLAHS